jgi:hypothetical protein
LPSFTADILSHRPQVLEAALDVIVLPQDVRGNGDELIAELDPEETSFQSSFSKLGASETAAKDPIPEITDARRYLSKELAAKSASRPGVVSHRIEHPCCRRLPLTWWLFRTATTADGPSAREGGRSFCSVHVLQQVSPFDVKPSYGRD